MTSKREVHPSQLLQVVIEIKATSLTLKRHVLAKRIKKF